MIRIQPGYSLRNVLDAYLIMGRGKSAYAPNTILSLNETGAFLWGILENGAEPETLVARMTEEFDVAEAQAKADVDAFLAQLREKALIIE